MVDTQRVRAPAVTYSTPMLDAVRAQVRERYGDTVMRKAVGVPGFRQTETGIFVLDIGLLGGIPEGLTTMIYGHPSGGKTTTAMRLAGRMQKKYPEKVVVWVDFEQTFNNHWAIKQGINLDTLEIVTPRSGEHGVDIIDALIRTPEISCIIIDSLPAMIPQKEGDASAEDNLMTLRARLVGRMCSKILDATTEAKQGGNYPTTIFINQWRTRIGGSPRANPYVLPCGMQPRFLSTTMFEIKNYEKMGKNDRGIEVVDHNEHSFQIKKSKVGNSIREGEFVMVRNNSNALGEGAIDESQTVVNFAKKFGFLTGGGQRQQIDGIEQPFGNMQQAADYLDAHPDECTDLKRRIIMAQRIDMGLPMLPPDGYLYGYVELAQ